MIFLSKEIGKGKYPFIVAELSCNHQGNLDQAKSLIQAAKDSGADAVKIQVYTADEMIYAEPIGKSGFFDKFISEDFIVKEGPWKGENLIKLYKRTQTDYNLANAMFEYAKEIDIPIFASVFSQKGLTVLEQLECPAYKIASFEITDTNLIRKVAKTGKPIVISTGLATTDDIYQALQCVNLKNVILLHCVSAYPTKLDQVNLWKIQQFILHYRIPVGFSDHTRGIIAGPIACAVGACMVEKHLALEGTDTEDSAFSLHPKEFERYVIQCRAAASTMWPVQVPDEEHSMQFRRSIYVVKDTKKGDMFTWDNIKAIRPSYGLPAQDLSKYACGGHFSKCDIKAGTALKKEHIK